MTEQWLLAMPGDRLNKLNQLFEASRGAIGGDYDDFKKSFVSRISPDERTQVLGSVLKEGCPDHERKIYEPLLKNLGHTDEEIRAMLPAKTAKP